MTPPTLHQLSDADAIFLSMETENAWGHVSGLSILDTREADDFSFERLLALFEERIQLVPRFTWKLVEVPLAHARRRSRHSADHTPSPKTHRLPEHSFPKRSTWGPKPRAPRARGTKPPTS